MYSRCGRATLCAAFLFYTLLGKFAYAAESIHPAGPIGGTDIGQAFLPPPGLYMAGVVAPADLFTYHAGSQAIPASGFSMVGGGGILYVYDTKIFGGSIASSISASYGKTCFDIQGSKGVCSKAGFNDIYSDILRWSRFFPSADYGSQPEGPNRIPYGLAVSVGLGVMAPTGSYSDNRSLNNSANFWDFAPNIALTYNMRSLLGPLFGQATEFSARVWFNNYTKNNATDYQTGRLINIDYAITQRYNQWQFGLAGTFFAQVADDNVHGVVPNDGNRAVGLSLGPVVSYNFVKANRPWNVTVKGLYGVAGRNGALARGVILKVGTRF